MATNNETPNEGWTAQTATARPAFAYQSTQKGEEILAAELPSTAVQQQWFGTSYPTLWTNASGNAANVNQIASRTAAAPTLSFVNSAQIAYTGRFEVVAKATVTAGYPTASITYDWGDGTTQSIRPLPPYQAYHKYAANGTYTVKATATNQTGSVNSTLTCTVTNGTPVWS